MVVAHFQPYCSYTRPLSLMLKKTMNSKLIRVLVIINGILIPIFILFVLGSVLYDEIKKDEPTYVDDSFFEEPTARKFSVQNSEPIKLPNSNLSYVTVEKKYASEYGEIDIEIENTPNMVRKNTVNVLFVNEDLSEFGKLLPENGSINSMFIENRFSEELNEIEKIEYIVYYIATTDSNNDELVDNYDQHYLYISDLNGKNLMKISEKRIRNFMWINGGKEMLLTFGNIEDENEIEYGIYNVKTKEIRQIENLNIAESTKDNNVYKK
jgi:hypothetical protein